MSPPLVPIYFWSWSAHPELPEVRRRFCHSPADGVGDQGAQTETRQEGQASQGLLEHAQVVLAAVGAANSSYCGHA